MEHVPYRGETPMLQDMLGGQIHGGFHSMAAAGEMIKAGRIRALATAGDRRIPALGEVPLLRDLGFSPTVNAPENRKVTVLVGPYSGDALLEAERKLDANGHDHFRIR